MGMPLKTVGSKFSHTFTLASDLMLSPIDAEHIAFLLQRKIME